MDSVALTRSIAMRKTRAWMTVPEAGEYLAGLGRSASYQAAARGEIPVLRIGRRLVVPVAKLRETMGLPAERAVGDGPSAA
jgi:excisionase family DNA binding protein